MNELTDKQQAFISEYLKDFNATRAAERAGYSGDDNTLAVTGYDLLRNPKIAELVKQHLSARAMTADEVLLHLAEMARGDYANYVDEHGEVNIKRLVKDGKAHLIKSIVDTKYGRRYEFYDRQSALGLLGKNHRLFADRIEHTGKDGEAIAINIYLPDNGRNSDRD